MFCNKFIAAMNIQYFLICILFEWLSDKKNISLLGEKQAKIEREPKLMKTSSDTRFFNDFL